MDNVKKISIISAQSNDETKTDEVDKTAEKVEKININ